MKPCQNCKRNASLLLIATTERDDLKAKMTQASRFTIGGTAGEIRSDMIHVERLCFA